MKKWIQMQKILVKEYGLQNTLAILARLGEIANISYFPLLRKRLWKDVIYFVLKKKEKKEKDNKHINEYR